MARRRKGTRFDPRAGETMTEQVKHRVKMPPLPEDQREPELRELTEDEPKVKAQRLTEDGVYRNWRQPSWAADNSRRL